VFTIVHDATEQSFVCVIHQLSEWRLVLTAVAEAETSASLNKRVQLRAITSRARARPRWRSVRQLCDIVARKTSCNDLSLIPWIRRTRSAYSKLLHDARTLVTWSADVSWSLTVTPRTRRVVTRIRYRKEHSASVVFSWCSLWHFSRENLLMANQPLLRNWPRKLLNSAK